MIYPEESSKIMKVAMILHRELGCGFKEKVYQDAFEVLLNEYEIPYERERRIQIVYHGKTLEHDFYYDFLFLIQDYLSFYQEFKNLRIFAG